MCWFTYHTYLTYHTFYNHPSLRLHRHRPRRRSAPLGPHRGSCNGNLLRTRMRPRKFGSGRTALPHKATLGHAACECALLFPRSGKAIPCLECPRQRACERISPGASYAHPPTAPGRTTSIVPYPQRPTPNAHHRRAPSLSPPRRAVTGSAIRTAYFDNIRQSARTPQSLLRGGDPCAI